MPRIWNLNDHLRGRVACALFAAAAAFAGAHGLAASVASAEIIDCTAAGDYASCANGATGGNTGSIGSTGSGIFSDNSSVWGTHGTDDLYPTPLAPDPSPTKALDGDYIEYWADRGYLDPRRIRSLDHPGDLDVLTDDCGRLSLRMGTLARKVQRVDNLIDRLDGWAARRPFQRVRDKWDAEWGDRKDEFTLLECEMIPNLYPGRD